MHFSCQKALISTQETSQVLILERKKMHTTLYKGRTAPYVMTA